MSRRWGTRLCRYVIRRSASVVSHPCDRTKSQGWGTEGLWLTGLRRLRQAEGVHLVVVRASSVGETRAPVEDAVHDGWAVHYAAVGVVAPEDLSGGSVERVYVPAL